MNSERDLQQLHDHEPLDPSLRTRLKRGAKWLGATGVGYLITQKSGNTQGIVDNLAWTAGYFTAMGGMAMTLISVAPEIVDLTECQ